MRICLATTRNAIGRMALLVGLSFGLAAHSVYAGDGGEHAWVASSGGMFAEAGNWNVGIPAVSDTAVFNLSSLGYTVELDGITTNDGLRIRNDSVIFDMGGFTYNLTSLAPTSIVVGESALDNGALMVENGTLTGVSATLGQDGGIGSLKVQDFGTVEVANNLTIGNLGTGSLTAGDLGAVAVANRVTVGNFGSGTLLLEDGGTLSSFEGFVSAEPGAVGEATIMGIGSSWTNTSSLYVGGSAIAAGGTGTLAVEDGGTVNVTGTLKVWSGGTVTLEGGTINTAALEIAAGAFSWTTGTLSADTIDVDLTNNFGTLAPGNTPSTTTVSGNYTQGPGGTLEIELAGTLAGEFDRLVITGNANLDGTLDVVLTNPFVPTAGQTFGIMSFTSSAGQFAIVNGANTLLGNAYLFVQHNATDITLVATYQGDGNLNGEVEAADYTIWANAFGMVAPAFTDGDYNGDGFTTAADYTLWANNFGQGAASPAGAVAAVPEPSTWVLLFIGAVALLWRRTSK